MDRFDKELLRYLQTDASISNAALGKRMGVSGLNAFVKVRLHSHSKASSVNFRELVSSLAAVRLACAITGDADYLLHVRLKDLQGLAAFINDQLLAHPDVNEVRSDVVLEMLKDDSTIQLD